MITDLFEGTVFIPNFHFIFKTILSEKYYDWNETGENGYDDNHNAFRLKMWSNILLENPCLVYL